MTRLIVAIVLASHGIGHVMGFTAAWITSASPFTDKPWIFSDAVRMDSAFGRVLGLLWLVPLTGFVAGAYGLWQQTDWWRPVLIASAIVSLPLVLPWWNAMPKGSYIGALLVDVAVLAALLIWGDDVMSALD